MIAITVTSLVLILTSSVGAVRQQPIKVGPMHIARPFDAGNKTYNSTFVEVVAIALANKRQEAMATLTAFEIVPETRIPVVDNGDPFHGECVCQLGPIYAEVLVFMLALLGCVGLVEYAKRKAERLRE